MKHLYGSDAIDQLARQYVDLGGQVYTLEEGSLGWGVTVLLAPGYKSVVIKEVYINPWSSGHAVRKYNQLPGKYQQIIDNY